MKSFLLIVIVVSVNVCQAQPGGESCANATVIPTVPFNSPGQMGLTDDCAGAPFRDVFYTFTPLAAGQYHVSMCGSSDDTMLRLWAGGCCVNLVQTSFAGCNDDPDFLFTVTTPGHPYVFELGYTSPASPRQGYLFVLTGPPQIQPCGGMLQISQASLSFPPTYVGANSVQQIVVSNTSASSDLCVSDLRTNGSVWNATPDSFRLGPNSQQVVLVTFAPTFEHDFLGVIEILSSDTANPVDSVLLDAIGCQAAVNPPMPVLRDANAPGTVYYEAPFLADRPAQEYAIEVVSEGVWVDYPSGTSETPVWATSSQWGIGGRNFVDGLTSGAPFQLRFHSRDCTGAQLAGPIANGNAPPDIVLANPDLTIKLLGDSTLKLSWKLCRDTSGREVANLGWNVFRGLNADSPLDLWQTLDAEDTTLTFIRQNDREFFVVRSSPLNHWRGARPFISWPPGGARVAGWTDVVIKDAVHKSEWDTFRIEADSMGQNLIIGTSEDNTTGLMSEYGTFANLSGLGNGPREITATVTDHSGTVYEHSVTVAVTAMPYATFTATYDSVNRRYTVTESGTVLPSGSTQIGTLWRFSHVAERYGPTVTVPWSPDFDSLMIVYCDPQVDHPPVYADDQTHALPGENGGLQPKTEQTPVTWNYIKCCCKEIVLNSGPGESDVKYKGQKGRLGPIAECDAGGSYTIGFAFSVSATYTFELAPAPSNCTCGQDAKGTRVISTGNCSESSHTCAVTKIDTVCKFNDARPTVRYCYSDTNDGFGNDGFGPADMIGQTEGRNRGPRDGTGLKGGRVAARKTGKAEGTTQWYDPALEYGKLGKNSCIHDVAHNKFFARADPSCNAEMPCCILWETAWDVSICRDENGCHVAAGPPPTITPLPVPAGGCPALAP